MSELNNTDTADQTQDAQLTAEEIASGDRPAVKVDVDADYEASKEFSRSTIDKSGQGEELAEKATAHKFETHAPEEPKHTTEATGNPDAYRDMAHDVNPISSSETHGNVDDAVVKHAIDLGKPGESANE